ncbi:MAG: hypothetical protein KAH09_09740, partial [Desulfobacula sp.]|nr:hypothetical protein [Desulfobacula sp.]
EKKIGSELSAPIIKSVCREQLHDLKCPKEILFTDHIPKNTMGKVLKEQVKQYFLIKKEKRTWQIRSA